MARHLGSCQCCRTWDCRSHRTIPALSRPAHPTRRKLTGPRSGWGWLPQPPAHSSNEWMLSAKTKIKMHRDMLYLWKWTWVECTPVSASTCRCISSISYTLTGFVYMHCWQIRNKPISDMHCVHKLVSHHHDLKDHEFDSRPKRLFRTKWLSTLIVLQERMFIRPGSWSFRLPTSHLRHRCKGQHPWSSWQDPVPDGMWKSAIWSKKMDTF